jgi:glycosyltransferase involved in cell wall biosynthesis
MQDAIDAYESSLAVAASPQAASGSVDAPTDASANPHRRRIIQQRHRSDRDRDGLSHSYPQVSVVIPTLNEAMNLPHVFSGLPDGLHEVIVVDGRSTDGTPAVARQLRPSVRIVKQDGRGKGDALRCGFEASTGDILVMLDADGSADPGEIPAFVDALVGGADFAKGSRFALGGGSADITGLRSAGNRILSRIVNLLFRTDYTDLCYGYNAFWRHCLPAMRVDCNGFEVETLINIRVARAGLTVTEVASFEHERIHGQSNLNTFRDGGRVLRTILRERLRRRAVRDDVAAQHERTTDAEALTAAVAPLEGVGVPASST